MATSTRKPVQLVRGLGLWAATAIVVGTIIGQSVFLAASDVSREVNSTGKVLLVWIAGGCIVLFGVLCYAELGAAFPEVGGDYVYLGRGLGEVWGFLFGWTSCMVVKPAAAAMIAAGMLRFVTFLLPSVSTVLFVWSIHEPLRSQPYSFRFTAAQPLAAGVVLLVTAVNYFGVRMMGRFQIVLTALKVAVVASILVLGLTARTESHPTAVAHFPAHAPIVAFLTALVPVMAAYNGFQSLGALGGELVEPRRNLPRAVICGTSLVVVLFILINWVYFRILTFSEVAQSQHVASDAVSRLLGQAGARYFTVAMIISALGSLHSGFLTGPRITYAMARDSKFFAFAGRLQPRFRTPSGALLLQGCMTILLVMTGTHEELYSYAMFATWTFLAFTPIALIRLRCAEPNLQRPFRVWAYPWTPAIFGVAATAISINLWLLRPVRSSIGLAIILSGLWFFYRWRSPQTDRSEGMRYGVRTSNRATDAA